MRANRTSRREPRPTRQGPEWSGRRQILVRNLDSNPVAVVKNNRAVLADLEDAARIRDGIAEPEKLLVPVRLFDDHEGLSAVQMGGAEQSDIQIFVLDGRRLGRGRETEDVALNDRVVVGAGPNPCVKSSLHRS